MEILVALGACLIAGGVAMLLFTPARDTQAAA
jgi:hypothetical protein